MSIQNLDFGTAADGDGEYEYTAWPKVQANFEDLYSQVSANAAAIAAAAAAFNESVDDRIAALLVAGSNVTLTYNDVANTLTVAASGGGGGGGLSDGDYGDIVVSSSATAINIDSSVLTTFGRTLTSAADKSAGRTALDLTYPIHAEWYGFSTSASAADNTTALNNALSGGNKWVILPAGDYSVAGHVRVYTNTLIEMQPDTKITLSGTSLFVNGEVGNTTYATGYGGDSHIKITGGEICCTSRTSGDPQVAFVQFAHGKNIVIEGVRFTSLWRGHFIDIAGCKQVRIRNCEFSGQTIDTGDSGRDAINIDYCYSTGFPLFGSNDDTPCEDVIVENNLFDGCQTSASSHGSTAPPAYPKGIKILNNTILNSGEYAIWGRYWDRPVIRGNRIATTAAQGVVFDTCTGVVFENNWVAGAGATSANHAIQLGTCTGCVVKNNIVTGSTHTYGLRAFSGSGNAFETANITAGTSGVQNITETASSIDGATNGVIPITAAMVVGYTAQVTTAGFTPVVEVHGTGASSSALGNYRWSNNAGGPTSVFSKSRSGTIGTNTVVQSGDALMAFVAAGADGTGFIEAARFQVIVDGTPGTNDMPGAIQLMTTADGASSATERMRIDNKGNVIMNTAAIATTATDGFLYVPTCAGTPTGVPTTYSGRAPIVINTTNNKLYFYSGGAWRDAGP